MKLFYCLPLVLLCGCLTVDPNAPRIPGVWRIYAALVLGFVVGFALGLSVKRKV